MPRFAQLLATFACLALVVACTNSPTPISTSTTFAIQISVTDTLSAPLSNAQVVVVGSGSNASVTKFTDNEGTAIFQIAESRKGEISQITVTKDGYNLYSRTVTLEPDLSNIAIKLDIQTADTPFATTPPIPPSEAIIEEASTPIKEEPESLPPTVAPPSPTPLPVREPTVRVLTQPINVYVGPSSKENATIFIARPNDELVPFARTLDNNWLNVRKPNSNTDGWIVNNAAVSWVSGNLEDIPFSTIFMAAVYPIDLDNDFYHTGQPSFCKIAIVWRNQADKFTVYWYNLPDDTVWIQLTIVDAYDQLRFLVPTTRLPYDSSTDDGFPIPFPESFSETSNYKILVQTFDSRNDPLCTRQMAFSH